MVGFKDLESRHWVKRLYGWCLLIVAKVIRSHGTHIGCVTPRPSSCAAVDEIMVGKVEVVTCRVFPRSMQLRIPTPLLLVLKSGNVDLPPLVLGPAAGGWGGGAAWPSVAWPGSGGQECFFGPGPSGVVLGIMGHAAP
jgi:hypothetical protein